MGGPLRPGLGGYGGAYETDEEKYARQLAEGIELNTNPISTEQLDAIKAQEIARRSVVEGTADYKQNDIWSSGSIGGAPIASLINKVLGKKKKLQPRIDNRKAGLTNASKIDKEKKRLAETNRAADLTRSNLFDKGLAQSKRKFERENINQEHYWDQEKTKDAQNFTKLQDNTKAYFLDNGNVRTFNVNQGRYYSRNNAGLTEEFPDSEGMTPISEAYATSKNAAGKIGSANSTKPNYRGSGTYINANDPNAQPIEGIVKDGILRNVTTGDVMGKDWISDPKKTGKVGYSKPENWFNPDGSNYPVYAGSDGNTYSQNSDGEYFKANLLGLSKKDPQEMTNAEYKTFQSNADRAKGQVKTAKGLQELLRVNQQLADSGWSKEAFNFDDKDWWKTAGKNIGRSVGIASGINQTAGSPAGMILDEYAGFMQQAVLDFIQASGAASKNWDTVAERKKFEAALSNIGANPITNVRLIASIYDKFEDQIGEKPEWLEKAGREANAFNENSNLSREQQVQFLSLEDELKAKGLIPQ
jgi:hypothetical protein